MQVRLIFIFELFICLIMLLKANTTHCSIRFSSLFCLHIQLVPVYVSGEIHGDT